MLPRERGVFDRAGEASVAVYVWHLTSLALCAAVIAAGLWAPPRFSTGWWLTRPLWIAAVLGVTGLLAGATALGRRRSHDEIVPRSPSTARIAIGLVAATVGAGVVGLLGPRTLPSATLAAVAFLTGWWCLRTPNAPRNPS